MFGLPDLFHNQNELILAVLISAFILFKFPIPDQIASVMDTTIGKIVLVLGALSLFVYTNPILGVLGMLFVYVLLQRTTDTTGSGAIYQQYQQKRWTGERYHFPHTLEQEMVKNMDAHLFKDSYEQSPYRGDTSHNTSLMVSPAYVR
jgi:hypothetical protein